MRKKLLALSGVVAVAMSLLAAPAEAALAEPQSYQMHPTSEIGAPGPNPWESGMCVTTKDRSSKDKAQVVQRPCNEGTLNPSRWVITGTGNGFVEIAEIQSHKCLNVSKGSTEPNAKVHIYDCGNHKVLHAQWKLTYVRLGQSWGSTVYRIQNRNSGLCLAVEDHSSLAGADLVQHPCGSITGDVEHYLHDEFEFYSQGS